MATVNRTPKNFLNNRPSGPLQRHGIEAIWKRFQSSMDCSIREHQAEEKEGKSYQGERDLEIGSSACQDRSIGRGLGRLAPM
jgi:hypothetical protein